MEQKESDVEMEVDGAGTFSQDEGEMQCGEESHQVQKEYNRNINDDSRNRSKINNSCVDEYLSNTFMKLSVKDGLSVSPAECDINRQVNCTVDGSHSKFTNPAFNSSPKHDENLKVLQDEPNDIMSGNIKTRSSVIDVKVNGYMNDTNKMSLPNHITAVDRKKQKQVMNNNTIEMSGAKSDCSNTVRKEIDIDGVLQKQKIIENVYITCAEDGCLKILSGEKNIKCLLHDARIDKSILLLSLSENSKAEGFYGNDHLTGLSLPLKLTDDIPNSFPRDLPSPLKEVEYGTNNGKEDLTSPQKEIGNGVSSLQRDTSLALTEKVHGDSDFRNSLQNDTSLALAEKAHSINSLQSSKLLELGKKVNGVKSLHNNSVSTPKEIEFDVDRLRGGTSSALEEKDHTVNSLKDYTSSTLKEKEHCVGSLCTSLSPTLKGKGQVVNRVYPDLSSTMREMGHGRDNGYSDSSLTLKGRKLQREVLKYEKNENIVVEVHENEIKHEQPYHCEEKYPHTNDKKSIQNQNNGKADVRTVYKTDFSYIKRPHEDKNHLEGFNSFDTFEHARCNYYRESCQTREERINNSTLDCNLDNELRQSRRKIGNRRKSKRENEWEIKLSHSNNGLDKRHDIKTKYRESYHQRINDIHGGKTQSSGSESNDNDTDECLHIEENKDKFASVQNSVIIDLVYRKLSWKSYLEINQHIGKWDCDRLDPFEQSLARCTFGSQKRKMFYRDLDAQAHHDSGEINGWNKGEFVFIGELSPGTNERVEAIPESFIEKGKGELTPEGGAIRKTNEKNTDTKRGEQRILQRSKGNAESNMEYGSSTESIERKFYGLPPDLFTEDETDSSDELQDKVCGIKAELQHQSQCPGYCSVLTRESPDITGETKTVGSCGVHSSLVKYLTRCKDFSSDMTIISSRFSLFENVKKFFEEHPDVFSISGNIVELRPKISLCEDFLSSYGCKNRFSCTKLHICDGFIVNICNDSNCIYGHNICTTHNKKALQSFWMENLDASTIIEVLRLSMLGAVNFQSLDICCDYNFSSCQNYNCKALHICIDYVGGLGLCIRPDCTLNHNIQTQNCINLLSSYGIDITQLGEEEKLLKVIQESYEITRFVQGYESKAQPSINLQLSNQQQQSSPYSNIGSIQEHKLNSVKLSESLQTKRNLIKPSETMRNPGAIMHSKPVHTALKAQYPSHLKNKPSSSQDNYSKDFFINGKSRTHAEGEGSKNFISELPLKIKSTFAYFSSTNDKVKPKNQKIGTKVSTVWSKYANGDVEIAEICYYSLNTVCKFESSGCQRLHAPMEFHWQMKVSLNVSWINLQHHQVFHLEKFYMDPSTEISEFPAPCSEEHPKIVHQILKDEKHFVNFTKLQLINAITFEIYELRRLHVQAKGKSDSFDVFLWYFKDIAGKWILYGNVDSSGDRHSATKIRSHDIEKRYLDNEAKFYFKNISGNSSYMLNFKKMVQVNMNTGSVREVRRRPKPTLSLPKALNL